MNVSVRNCDTYIDFNSDWFPITVSKGFCVQKIQPDDCIVEHGIRSNDDTWVRLVTKQRSFDVNEFIFDLNKWSKI